MQAEPETKTIVSVAEMARMCSLSRARFYQLLRAGTFPTPLYDVRTRRPVYSEELQQACLNARRRNCGVDGKPVLFYARGLRPTVQSKPKKVLHHSHQLVGAPTNSTTGNHADLIDGLAALGLSHVTPVQIDVALKELSASGTLTVDRGEVLRAVFLHIKRRDAADNAGR